MSESMALDVLLGSMNADIYLPLIRYNCGEVEMLMPIADETELL